MLKNQNLGRFNRLIEDIIELIYFCKVLKINDEPSIAIIEQISLPSDYRLQLLPKEQATELKIEYLCLNSG